MQIITTIDHNDETWKNLLLETLEDVKIYSEINAQIKSRQSVGFWFGFKTQKYYDDPLNYAAHQLDSNNSIARVLALKMNYSATLEGRTETSLADYCGMADKLIADITNSMIKYINEGKFVRVNSQGGFCGIRKDEKHIIESHVINEQEMYNYILNGSADLELKIKSDTIVIENGGYVPKELIKKYCELTSANPENIQVISNFKYKTILFKKDDWFKLFLDVNNKDRILPRNIIFETSAEDLRQISSLKELLENLHIPLDIYIGGSKWRIEKQKHLFQTDCEKIKIHYLEN